MPPHGQLQLDVYGEVMDALHQARRGGLAASEAGWDAADARCSSISRRSGSKPDDGIWEVRGEPQHFTYSKVMAWVAFDRAIKSAEQFGLPAPLDRWRELRSEIHDDVCAQGLQSELGSFVQSYGSQPARREPAAPAAGRLPAGRAIRACAAPSRRSSAT